MLQLICIHVPYWTGFLKHDRMGVYETMHTYQLRILKRLLLPLLLRLINCTDAFIENYDLRKKLILYKTFIWLKSTTFV